MKMDKIAAFIIGAQKAGTTSLYEYIKGHPDICFSSPKELTFFIDQFFYNKGEKYLNSFFSDFSANQIRITAHTHMLASADAPKRLFDYNANAKLIVCLRNPVDRARSAYNYAISKGWETRSLVEAIEKGPINRHTDYLAGSMYFRNLERWSKYFKNDRLLLIKSTNLKSSPQFELTRLSEFLGINDDYNTNFEEKHNVAGKPRIRLIHSMMHKDYSRSVLSKLIPGAAKRFIKQRVFGSIKNLNTKETSFPPLTKEEYTLMSSLLADDLKNLYEKYGINFQD
jgi:hypothetical protein